MFLDIKCISENVSWGLAEKPVLAVFCISTKHFLYFWKIFSVFLKDILYVSDKYVLYFWKMLQVEV